MNALRLLARPSVGLLRAGHGRALRTSALALQKDFAHLPLGHVPDGTDLEGVRTKWGSNAMDLINESDIVQVDGDYVLCDGGGGALGHPIEYIKLNVSDEGAGFQVCKYCGTRYMRKVK